MAIRMKILIILLMVSATYAVSSEMASRYFNNAISVVWVAPDKYRDVNAINMNNEKYQKRVLDELEKYIHEELTDYLLDGQTVSLNVHDLDLAGDVHPISEHGNDIRIIKNIYPPMIDVQYSLLDAKGEVVRRNRNKFRDIGFELSSISFSDHSLGYEKAMLKKLLKREFRQ